MSPIFILISFSEVSGVAKGGEQTSHLQGRTESQQEKKGNKTKAQKSGSFEGFQVPLSGRKKKEKKKSFLVAVRCSTFKKRLG